MTVSASQLVNLCGCLMRPGTLSAADPSGFRERTREQQDIHETIVNTIMGDYAAKVPSLAARPMNDGDKIEWDAAFEKQSPGAWVGQEEGSCVPTNGLNTMMMQVFVESIIKQTGEQMFVDWCWLKTYGDGRYYGGLNGEGHGSFLSAQFESYTRRGIPRQDQSAAFPRYTEKNGARWVGGRNETWWSDRKNYGDKYDDLSDDHLLLDGAMATGNWQDKMQAIIHGSDYGPIGLASMLGIDGFEMIDGFKVAKWNARWAHNQGICGKAKHPTLGLLFKIMNRSWTPSDYASYWLPEKELAKVVKDRGTEIMFVRDFKGIEAAGIDLDWLINLIMSL